MQIRKFEAPDMAQALMMVKQDFGPNAVILSARALNKQRGLLNFFNRPKVEITAATDNGISDNYGRSLNHWKVDDSDQQNDTSYNRITKLGTAVHHDIKKFNNKFFSPQKVKNEPEITDTRIHALYQGLLEHEIDREIALELIRTVQKNKIYSTEKYNDYVYEGLVLGLKEARINAHPITLNHKKEVIAFVGPTGVGKTSSILKLATLNSVKRKKSVSVISLDSNRIGTCEQLKVFEKIIGVPTEVAFEPKELTASIKKFKNHDLIFIDTPCIIPKNDEEMKEIKRLLHYCSASEIHLVLSATTKERDLEDIIEKFLPLSIGRLLFTKIDESSTHGLIINQLYKTKVPLSYLANGQRIPDDIEDATIERLVDLITNGGYQFPNQKVINHKTIVNSKDFSNNNHWLYVSNKKSLFFHHADCDRVKKIKEGNIVLFKSQSEANQKGLKPCKVCLKKDVLHHIPPTNIAEMV